MITSYHNHKGRHICIEQLDTPTLAYEVARVGREAELVRLSAINPANRREKGTFEYLTERHMLYWQIIQALEDEQRRRGRNGGR